MVLTGALLDPRLMLLVTRQSLVTPIGSGSNFPAHKRGRASGYRFPGSAWEPVKLDLGILFFHY